jgi:hypothetical protein
MGLPAVGTKVGLRNGDRVARPISFERLHSGCRACVGTGVGSCLNWRSLLLDQTKGPIRGCLNYADIGQLTRCVAALLGVGLVIAKPLLGAGLMAAAAAAFLLLLGFLGAQEANKAPS